MELKTREVTELKRLYRVDLVEKDGQHFYTIDKQPTYLKGVTGILNIISKQALVPWASKATAEHMAGIIRKVNGRKLTERFITTLIKRSKKQPKLIKEKSANVGSYAHETFDNFIKNKKLDFLTTEFADSFKHWMLNEKLKIVQGDTKIASKTYGYGGSLDALAIDENGHYVVIDFKTGNSLYDTHALQVAAYGNAFTETFEYPYMPNGVVIRFEKGKPKFERREVRDMHDSFSAFKCALDLSALLELTQYKNREIIKETKNVATKKRV